MYVSVYVCIYQREMKIYVHKNVRISFIYSSKKMVTAQISNNRWMDQLIAVYLYNGIWLSHQKEENTDTHNNID